jgi:sugar lactone lactonase YvrE
MRNTIPILTSLLLSASSLCAQASPTQSPPSSVSITEPQLLGTWVALHRSLGGLGSMWTFLPHGQLEMSMGAIVEGWYTVKGDKLIEPPATTLPDAMPQVTLFRIEGDTLIKQYDQGEMRLLRVGKAEHAAPIVGVWRQQSQATADSIVEEQRKAGHEVDQQSAQRMADIMSSQLWEYAGDGLTKFRLPMRTTRGTYDVATRTFILAPENSTGSSPFSTRPPLAPGKRGGRFRLENGLLVLTQPDGKTEDTYISAEATKEQLKRAGVRYGDKPAELDPPSGVANGMESVAPFNTPWGVATDSSGNVYVTDTNNHTVRMINPGGAITTLAGLAGNSGSADGTGSRARFNHPLGVATDNSANVYVADTNNQTIRKITPSGAVTTLAGLAGNGGSADGMGSAARFGYAYGVTTDSSGNIYVADAGNNTIRKITVAGGVTTLAGLAGHAGRADGIGSAARFNNPNGVATDSSGNIYVADRGNNTIRKVTPAGAVTTLAGLAGTGWSTDGTGSEARFDFPQGVATDSSGNVYVADSNSHTIRRITPAGEVTTIAGARGCQGSADGTGSEAWFNWPQGVATDGSGNVYVVDTNNRAVRMITPAGVVTTIKP